MLEVLSHIDQELFLFLNSLHNPFWDIIMYWSSKTITWIPLWLYFIFLIIRKYKNKWCIILIALFIAVGMSDYISVHLFKNVFERLRPCHNPQISTIVHIVKEHCGGQYGFVSSHAANMFAIATFMYLAFKNQFTRIWIPLYFWATWIAYSRIYLGVHYPGDVIGGALVGSIIAILIWYILKKTSFFKNIPNNL